MQIFKKVKNDDSLEQRIISLEGEISTLRLEWASFKRRYEGAVEELPSVARIELLNLARQKSIYAATTYRDKEFYTKLIADETAELKNKKCMLEQAIKDVDAALAGLKTDKKE